MYDNPIFSAILTPHRSLGQVGLRWVVGIYGVLGLIPGLFFLFSGAWPVVGFLGLDALLLYWALKTSMQSGRVQEQVTLWVDNLQIDRFDTKGRRTRKTFNPFWAKLYLARDFDDQITHIQLQSRGASLEIGSFLNPDDKTSFAQAFSQALKGLSA